MINTKVFEFHIYIYFYINVNIYIYINDSLLVLIRDYVESLCLELLLIATNGSSSDFAPTSGG